jgi:CheY-like chemotaxis protein
MALRVLLADESSTIKKVIGLSLQDFAVEVKVVQSGVDVIEVAKQFKPDLIFADVLLQKRNGYEVCFDLKNDPELAQIPVVLMWSSFMDLDEKAYIRSQANAKLEKPFEVDHLRQLVTQLSQRAQTQKASPFLKFPPQFAEPLKNEMLQKQDKSTALSENTLSRLGIPAPPTGYKQGAQNVSAPPQVNVSAPPQPNMPTPPAQKPTAKPPQNDATWNMESFEDIQVFSVDDDASADLNKSIEDFSEMRLTPQTSGQPGTNPAIQQSMSKNYNLSEGQEPWAQKNLNNFKIDTSDEADPFALMDLNSIEFTQSPVASKAQPQQNVTSEIKLASPQELKPQQSQPLALDDANEIQSFDFSDEDLNDHLSLDETRAAPQAVENAQQQQASSWNFQLPEHEKSPHQPGDILELPPELENSDISKLAHHALEGNRQATQSLAPTDSFNGVGVDPALIEKIVREQTRELVEKIVHRILPDMARTLIQTELDRLLSEENS